MSLIPAGLEQTVKIKVCLYMGHFLCNGSDCVITQFMAGHCVLDLHRAVVDEFMKLLVA